MTLRNWVELIAAGSIPFSMLLIFLNRWLSGKSIGVRAIQMLAIMTLIPTVIVLAMERVLDGAAVAALLGGAVGYLFANFSEYDRQKANPRED